MTPAVCIHASGRLVRWGRHAVPAPAAPGRLASARPCTGVSVA
jgi:hypothetical protein